MQGLRQVSLGGGQGVVFTSQIVNEGAALVPTSGPVFMM